MVDWRFSWHESLDRLKLSTSLFFDYQEFPIIWRYINCATRVVSLSLQPREFIRLTMRWKRGAGSLCELFIALWLNSNHFSRVTDREMLSALIEGIDFPTPFGAHWRDTIRGFGFQKKKTSSSALITWSIINIKTGDLQQSLFQCLYFLSSIGLQICWVKVILTDLKENSKQQQ